VQRSATIGALQARAIGAIVHRRQRKQSCTTPSRLEHRYDAINTEALAGMNPSAAYRPRHLDGSPTRSQAVLKVTE